jgi:hypothetical protein
MLLPVQWRFDIQTDGAKIISGHGNQGFGLSLLGVSSPRMAASLRLPPSRLIPAVG